MVEKLEVTIDVIIHATEDISKIFEAFEDMFGLAREEFAVEHIVGHFDNPITTINAKLVKNHAANFIEKLIGFLSGEQIHKMIKEIGERTVDSRYHIRIDKQELINRKIVFKERDAVKLKIYTPIYNKKNTVEAFTQIFRIAN